MAIYRAQNVYQEEGAKAGLAGARREDCPYDKEANPDGWNFWVWGCEDAASEAAVIASGFVSWCTETSLDPVLTLPVREAIESGQWKPRWARLPA